MNDSVTGGTKWTTVKSALQTFVTQPNLTGISMGIGFFGVPAGGGATCSAFTCNTTADCGAAACGPCTAGICTGAFSSGGDSCTASDYATPEVEIMALPGVGNMIMSSINAHSPSTSTPTSAALQGAIDHAASWATSHVGHTTVVVLATDGDPTECDTSLTNIDAIASAGVAMAPSIKTFVIGVGPDTTNLNGIAVAGGTQQAFLVDTGGNVNQQFLAAMNSIRNSASCTYQIPLPANGTPDYTQVNVVYTPNGGSPTTIPNVANQAACPANGDGWFYDNAAAPTAIILCTHTCGTVSADASGSVDIALGCATVTF